MEVRCCLIDLVFGKLFFSIELRFELIVVKNLFVFGVFFFFEKIIN